jgi:hypothetical protein
MLLDKLSVINYIKISIVSGERDQGCLEIQKKSECTDYYNQTYHYVYTMTNADQSGRVVWVVGLQPLAWWDYGFESRLSHRWFSLVSNVCCQVDIYVSGWSVVQRSHTECGVSECDREAWIMRRPWPTGGSRATRKNDTHILLSPFYVAFPKFIAVNCSWSFIYCVIILCVSLLPYVYCFTMCVLLSYVF